MNDIEPGHTKDPAGQAESCPRWGLVIWSDALRASGRRYTVAIRSQGLFRGRADTTDEASSLTLVARRPPTRPDGRCDAGASRSQPAPASPGEPAVLRLDAVETLAQPGQELLRCGAASQHESGEGPKLRRVARQAVRLAILVDLQEMLHPPEEQVVAGELFNGLRRQDARFCRGP